MVAMVALVAAAAAAGCKSNDKLAVYSIDPVEGSYEGGQTVKINGNGFMENGAMNAKVYFGDRQGTVIKFEGDSTLWVTAPGGKKGETVDVKINFEGKGVVPEKKGLLTYKYVEVQDVDVNDLAGSGTGSAK
jgi:hypothetical protein